MSPQPNCPGFGTERAAALAPPKMRTNSIRAPLHAGPQLVEIDQVFLVGLHEPLDTLVTRATRAQGGDRLAVAGSGQQGGDLCPDELVEVVGPDRLVGADPPVFVAVVVRSQAATLHPMVMPKTDGLPAVRAISSWDSMWGSGRAAKVKNRPGWSSQSARWPAPRRRERRPIRRRRLRCIPPSAPRAGRCRRPSPPPRSAPSRQRR